MDIHGRAILDYYKGLRNQPLMLHNSYGEPEEMPVEVFFRESEDFTELEQIAISHCRGSVLDIGAGAGAHALFLQALGADITAIENSPGCIETLEKSGLQNVIQGDFRAHAGKYDTLLLLMNGLGIAGTLKGIQPFLNTCKRLLSPDGKIILDSSDIGYLYDDIQKPTGYYGEIRYRYEYKGQNGDWFDWVYVDQDTLSSQVTLADLNMELLAEDENDQYLARIYSK